MRAASRIRIVRLVPLFLISAIAFSQVSAHADVLCVKNRQKVRGGKIVLKNAVKRVVGECPKGFTEITSTDDFKGDTGESGADGVSGYEIVSDTALLFLPAFSLERQVNCPEGKIVIGGGCDSQIVAVHIEKSMPVVADNGWFCRITHANTSFAGLLEVYAICANG